LRTCSVEGCTRKYYLGGYCRRHWDDTRTGLLPKLSVRLKRGPICSVDGCDKDHYEAGLCHSHYYYERKRTGYVPKWQREPKYGCLIEGCKNQLYVKDYCRTHSQTVNRIINNRKAGRLVRIDRPNCAATDCPRKAYKKDFFCSIHEKEYQRPKYPKGENHWSWRGGVAEYPDHSLLKKQRLVKLASVQYECEVHGPACKKVADRVHHKDGLKTNHDVSNLVATCSKCHFSSFHSGVQKSNKRTHNGKRLYEWAKLTGLSTATCFNFFKGRSSERVALIMRFALEPQLRDQLIFLRRNAEMAD
jgi:hypothetical protein